MAVVSLSPSNNGEHVDPTAQSKLTNQQRRRRNRKKSKQAQNPGVGSSTGIGEEFPVLASSDTVSLSGDDSFLDADGDRTSRSKARKLRRQRAKQRSKSQGEDQLERGGDEITEPQGLAEKGAPQIMKVVERKENEPQLLDEPEPVEAKPKPSDPEPIATPSPKHVGMEGSTGPVAEMTPKVNQLTSGEGEITEPDCSAEECVPETSSVVEVKTAEHGQLFEPAPDKVETKHSNPGAGATSSAVAFTVAESIESSSTKQVEVERSTGPDAEPTREVVESRSLQGIDVEPTIAPIIPKTSETSIISPTEEQILVDLSALPIVETNGIKADKSLRVPEVVETPTKDVDSTAATSPTSVAYIDDPNTGDLEDCNCAACSIM